MPALSDRDWRAKDDARTLAEAEVIKQDKDRLIAAQDAAKRMAEEKNEEARAMKKVAGRKKTSVNPRDGLTMDNSKPNSKTLGGNSLNVFKRI